MQRKSVKLCEVTKKTGFEIITDMTVVVHININQFTGILVNDIDPEEVDEFVYLSSVSCKNGGSDKNV